MIADTLHAPPDAAPTPRAEEIRVTGWMAAFGLVAAGGLLLRLLALAGAPFAPQEAAAAWPALRDALGQPVDGMAQPVSALLYSLQTLTFWLVQNANEAQARLPVALLSAVVPALAWFWQGRLGRVGALLLALLLAVDPWQVTFGRMGAGAGLSAALALISLTALEVAGREPRRGPLGVAAVGAGLLLVSGPQAWSWLVVVAAGALLIGTPLEKWRAPRLWVGAAAAAVLGATAGLSNAGAARAVASSLGEWGAQVLPGAYPFWFPWLRLLVDNPLLLVLGLSGLVLLAVRFLRAGESRERHHQLLLLWGAWGVLLALAPGRVPDALPVLSASLAFVAAAVWGPVLARAVDAVGDWRELALVAAVLVAVLLALLFLFVSIVATPLWEGSSLVAGLALFLLTMLLVAGYAWFVNAQAALLVGLGVSGLFLLGATSASLADLAFRHDARHPDGFFATVALPEADNLTADAESLSWLRTGHESQMRLHVANGPALGPDAQVGWLVRPMRNVTWAAAPPAAVSPSLLSSMNPTQTPRPLVVTPPTESGTGVTSTAWNASYLGAGYPIRSAWLPNALPRPQGDTWQQRWESGIRPRLRWLIYREATPPTAESVLLWAPAE